MPLPTAAIMNAGPAFRQKFSILPPLFADMLFSLTASFKSFAPIGYPPIDENKKISSFLVFTVLILIDFIIKTEQTEKGKRDGMITLPESKIPLKAPFLQISGDKIIKNIKEVNTEKIKNFKTVLPKLFKISTPWINICFGNYYNE